MVHLLTCTNGPHGPQHELQPLKGHVCGRITRMIQDAGDGEQREANATRLRTSGRRGPRAVSDSEAVHLDLGPELRDREGEVCTNSSTVCSNSRSLRRSAAPL